MCGICGSSGGDFHWSSSLALADAEPHEFRRQRRYRISVLNKLLGPLGVRVEDFQNRSLLVSGATGATEIVEDLAQLWIAVDLISKPEQLDPLNDKGIWFS